MHVAAVILAAGQARRMAASGSHKLLAEFDGVPLVRKSVLTVLGSTVDHTILVTGYRSGELERAIAGLECSVVYNPDFATGMASSLTAGLCAVSEETDGLLVMLADMPGVVSGDIDRLVAAFRGQEGRAIVRAVSNGKRGNPVILPRATFESILRLHGDVGARSIIDNSGLIVIDIEIGDAAHLDTDTPEQVVAAGGVLAG